jgi:preprotein translocase subunit SecG
MNDKNKKTVGRAAFLSIVFMIIFAVYGYYQIDKYEEGMADIYAEEQDGYVSLVSERVKSGSAVISTAEDTVEVLDSSNSKYWTLDDKSTILYIKNVSETNLYRNLDPEKYYKSKSAKKFLSELNENDVKHSIIEIEGKKYIASGILVGTDDELVRMVLLTDYQILFSNNVYLSNKIFLSIAIASVALIFVICIILMAIYIFKEHKRSEGVREQNKLLQEKLESISNHEGVKEILMKRTLESENEVVEDTKEEEPEIKPEPKTPEVKPEPKTPEVSEAPKGEMTMSEDEYIDAHIVKSPEQVNELFSGIDEREIYPSTVLACKLRNMTSREFYTNYKGVFKRDAVWISENDATVALLFVNKSKNQIMDFVWKNIVYQKNVVAYKLFDIDSEHKSVEIKKAIDDFFEA